MLVVKFGGTSVGSTRAISRVIEIIKDKKHAGKTQVAVISAFSGVTDDLIDISQKAASGESYREKLNDLAERHRKTAAFFLKKDRRKTVFSDIDRQFKELEKILDGITMLRELSLRSLDLAMSFGERLSASVLTHIFINEGIPAAYLDASTLIKTNDNFGNADYIPGETYKNIKEFFSPKNSKWKNNKNTQA